jgi:hypothetical protein
MCGAAACACTVFLIDPLAAILAAVFVFILYTLLRRKVLQVRFGDARWGFIYSRVRDNLLKLAKLPADPKNWRPTVLVLTGDPEARLSMAMYGLWIGKERGLVILARILVGDLLKLAGLRETAVGQLNRFLQDNEFDALSSVVVSTTLDEGLTALLQGHAIGPLRPNVVLMGWSTDQERAGLFVKHLNSVLLMGMSLILFWDQGLPKTKMNRRIDIWWRGQENGSLMILMAHLLMLNWEWSEAKVRLLRLIQDEAGRQPATLALKELVDAARIDAEVQVLVSEDPFTEVLHRHSEAASVVLLGFKLTEENDADKFKKHFEQMLSGLPTTLLVCSSGEADLLA